MNLQLLVMVLSFVNVIFGAAMIGAALVHLKGARETERRYAQALATLLRLQQEVEEIATEARAKARSYAR